MKKGHKLTEFIQTHWLWAYVVAMLAIPGIVNWFMYLAIPTRLDLTAPTWLTFWGSYLGGAIGCMPALAALYDNREEARRQHEESEKSRRLSAMPVMVCEDNSTTFSLDRIDSLSIFSGVILLNTAGFHNAFRTYDPSKYKKKLEQIDDSYSGIFYFDFHNIGAGPALNVSFSCLNVPQHDTIPLMSIGPNERKSLLVCVQIPPEADENYQVQYNIGITFHDIFGNHYVQIQPLICRKDQHGLGNISIPELVME